MSSSDREDLKRALRDERAIRADLERRLGRETEKADVWRKRAEERSERIEKLQARGFLLNRLKKSLRPADGTVAVRVPATPPAPGSVPETTRTGAVIPSVRVGACVSTEGLLACLRAASVESIDSGADALEGTDLVVVEPATLRRLPENVRGAFWGWAKRDTRQPLVVWEPPGEAAPPDPELAGAADLVGAASPGRSDIWSAAGASRGHVLLPTFDAARHSPLTGGADWGDEDVVTVDESDLVGPSLDLIRTAAAGAPVVVAGRQGGVFSDRASVAARRWAYRNHAPWVRFASLLADVGVPAPPVLPDVACILVSMRPEMAEEAIAGLARQTYPSLEVIVGLHGAGDPGRMRSALDHLEIRGSVIRLDGELSLGACLNAAISQTGASLFAKIDDDDHYGPAYIEDAVHAHRYSGADIVGKGAHFVYLAESDRTILRRPRDEETFIAGTFPGPSTVIRKALWDAVRYPHRPRFVDTIHMNAARGEGASLYANSRWGFYYVRGRADHTFQASSALFEAGAVSMFEGYRPAFVEVADL